jgi:hypothetical protein
MLLLLFVFLPCSGFYAVRLKICLRLILTQTSAPAFYGESFRPSLPVVNVPFYSALTQLYRRAATKRTQN